MFSKRILSLDIGIRKTGLAISGQYHFDIKLLSYIVLRKKYKNILFLVDLCIYYKVKYIIIGYLKNIKVNNFVNRNALYIQYELNKIFNHYKYKIRIFLINEHHSSSEAKRLIKNNLSRKHIKYILDSTSAAILIEKFILEYNF